MSTPLGSTGGIDVTRLEGAKRGVRYQLTNLGFTDDGDFIVVTAKVLKDLVALIEEDAGVEGE